MNFTKSQNGSVAFDAILFTFIIVFVVFPIFSFVVEKYIVYNSSQLIKDSLDMAGIATYNSLNNSILSKASIQFDSTEILNTYKKYLAANLKLKPDLTPEIGSLAQGPVKIEQLNIYTSGFPIVCPVGNSIVRPSIHVVVAIPLRPSLYRDILLVFLGKDYVELKVHQDTELPINN